MKKPPRKPLAATRTAKRTAAKPLRKRLSGAHEDSETTFPLNEWMVPSQDAHGHSAKVISRVPPSYKHQFNLILQKGKFPWDTESDIVRVAIHRLLNVVSKVMDDPEITSVQSQLNALQDVASREMQYLHFRETLERLLSVTEGLVREGAFSQARKMFETVKANVEQFEDPEWKEKYRAELIDRYEQQIKKGKKS